MAGSHTDTSAVDLATINQTIANMDGATATSSAGSMGDIDHDLRCHFLMMILLLFLQKQNLASAIYLFGLGTLLSGPGLKHMR